MTRIFSSPRLWSVLGFIGLISPIVMLLTLDPMTQLLLIEESISVANDPLCKQGRICDLGFDMIAAWSQCAPILIYVPAFLAGIAIWKPFQRKNSSIRMWQTIGISLGMFTLVYVALVGLWFLTY